MPRHKLSVQLSAYAKLNLFLDIEGVRNDGYHLLNMVNVKISVFDDVTCSLTAKPEIVLTCNDSRLPTDSSNTAWRAAQRFREQTRLTKGIVIRLHKRIPHGAGLGGGSSDAAAVLSALSMITYDPIPKGGLQEIAASIGADVPFFLESGICVCCGVGERVIPVPSVDVTTNPPLYGVLCSPDQPVSTKQAYKEWDQMASPDRRSAQGLLNCLMQNQWEEVPFHCFNAFEQVVFANYDRVRAAYETFCSISPTPPRLTGSGSNLYSLHLQKSEAQKVAKKMKAAGLTVNVFHLVA